MGLAQTFKFKRESDEELRAFLRQQFVEEAVLDDREDFFVFSQLPGQPLFNFDCEMVQGGLRSERDGQYFTFLGMFIEALTGRFGAVEVEDV